MAVQCGERHDRPADRRSARAPPRGPPHEDHHGRLRPGRPLRPVGRLPRADHGERRRPHGVPTAARSATRLTGDTSEEVLFFAHGPTATGKTRSSRRSAAVLGDYAATADFETFLKRHGDAGIRNDVARLAGARLVISVEVDDGQALAEGLLKLLTGGDTVAARFLYRETFEFRPVFKLWLAANDRPRVNADDAAMWRRILQLPFVQRDPRGRARRARQARAAHRSRRPGRDPRLGRPGLPRVAAARTRRPGSCATTPPRTAPSKTRSATGSPTARRSRPSRLDHRLDTQEPRRAWCQKQRRTRTRSPPTNSGPYSTQRGYPYEEVRRRRARKTGNPCQLPHL